MSNNFNRQLENYAIGKDLVTSVILHVIILLIMLSVGFLGKTKLFKASPTLIVSANALVNNNVASITNNQPVHANLIEHKFIQEAINRQAAEAKDQILRTKKIQQQEQQLAQLKKLAEQDSLRLKQEAEKIKQETQKIQKDKDQLKKQHEELKKNTDKLQKQAKELALQQEKLTKLKSEKLTEKKNSQLTQTAQTINQKKTINNHKNEQPLDNYKTSQLAGQNSSDNYKGLQQGGGMQQTTHNQIEWYQAKWKADIINNRKKLMLFPVNITCAIRIKLAPDGRLALVKLEKSSGNTAYDTFSEQAIYKSEPFEMPTDPVINKELTEIEHIFEFDDSEFHAD